MLKLNNDEHKKIVRADALEAKAKALRSAAYASRDDRERKLPLIERLTFAAYARCPCGHGMAYDRLGESGAPGGYWDCSAILLGIADQSVKHEAQMPFAFYKIKSENEPSTGGATTREPIEAMQ